jgi:predicted 3-demethylubiquinone-9 3-methyltransferase (glyoxalase superfamily)
MPNAQIQPFLLFEGNAEEAMNLYISIFSGAKILELHRYGPNQAGQEGSIMRAVFSIKDLTLLCTDSVAKHGFTFTPSVSLFVNCDSEEEINRLYESLSANSDAFMPICDYGFSRRFAWLSDRFGVSWQLNLA